MRSDRTGDDLAAIDAHPHFYRRVLSQLLVQIIEAPAHLEGNSDGAFRMVLLRVRRSEHCHDAITDEFVQRAVVLENDIRHAREIVVQKLANFERLHFLGHGRETNDIRKNHRDLELLNFLLSLRHDALGDGGGEVFLETLSSHLLLLNFLVQVGLLDGNRCVVPQGRQQL